MKQNLGFQYECLTVPYDLSAYAVMNKKFTEIQVLLACKFLFNCRFSKKDVCIIAKALNLTERTVKDKLKWLSDKNLIGFDAKKKFFYNRSFDYLRKYLRTKKSRSCGYYFYFSDLKKFRAFAIGCTINDLIISQKAKAWHRKKREGGKKGNPFQTDLTRRGFFPIAVNAYAKIFNVSRATASRYRLLAAEEGFINLKEDLKIMEAKLECKKDADLCRAHSGFNPIYKRGRYYNQGITHVKCEMFPIYF